MRDTICFRAASHQSSRKRKALSVAVIHGTANFITISFLMRANKHEIFDMYKSKSPDSDEVENVKFNCVNTSIVVEGSSSDNSVADDMIGALINENIILLSTVSFKGVKLRRDDLINLDKCTISKVEDVPEFEYDDHNVKLSDITQKQKPRINGDQLVFRMTAKLVPIKTDSARKIL